MRANFGYRVWYYFRVGWSTYFALLFAGINTATITYFLAIERVPALETIFPTFLHYVAISLVVILPILVTVGWVHYRQPVPTYSACPLRTIISRSKSR